MFPKIYGSKIFCLRLTPPAEKYRFAAVYSTFVEEISNEIFSSRICVLNFDSRAQIDSLNGFFSQKLTKLFKYILNSLFLWSFRKKFFLRNWLDIHDKEAPRNNDSQCNKKPLKECNLRKWIDRQVDIERRKNKIYYDNICMKIIERYKRDR